MKKLFKLVLEIRYAFNLARKWHEKFSKVLQFIRADKVIQDEISIRLHQRGR